MRFSSAPNGLAGISESDFAAIIDVGEKERGDDEIFKLITVGLDRLVSGFREINKGLVLGVKRFGAVEPGEVIERLVWIVEDEGGDGDNLRVLAPNPD